MCTAPFLLRFAAECTLPPFVTLLLLTRFRIKNMIKIISSVLLLQRSVRQFSSEAPAPTKPAPGGAGFLQRVSSFLVGAGLTALATQYFIYEEVRAGNQLMIRKQAELESRVSKLEKSKK